MRPRLVVETNFLDGLVLERDGADAIAASREILRLAERRRIDLAVPAFSLMEAESTFRAASKGRNRKITEFRNDERELGRSLLADAAKHEYEAFRTAYLDLSRRESQRFDALYAQVVAFWSVIPLDGEVLARAPGLADPLDLGLADAVVFASCLDHLADAPGGSPRIFLTQDRRGFDKEAVRAELDRVDAELVLDVRNALHRLRSALVEND